MKKCGFGVGLWKRLEGKTKSGENVEITATPELQEVVAIKTTILKPACFLSEMKTLLKLTLWLIFLIPRHCLYNMYHRTEAGKAGKHQSSCHQER